MIAPRDLELYGGIETHIRKLLEHLPSSKFRVKVLCGSGKRGVTTLKGARVRKVRAFSLNESYHLAPTLYSHVRKTDFDILHVHGYNSLTTPTSLLAAKDESCILTLHSSGTSSSLRRLLRIPYQRVLAQMMSHVKGIICVSEFEKKLFRRKLRLPEDKFEVIPSGVEAVDNVGSKKIGDPMLISVGRLEKYKGHARTIKAFEKFKVRRPKAKLVIVGNGPDRNYFASEAAKRDLSESVVFLSGVGRKRLFSLLNGADLFVLLSRYESQGIAAVEAISAGVPLLLSYNTALRKYVDEGFGMGVEAGDTPSEISKKMSEAISMGVKQRLQTVPKWSEVGERHADLYYKVAEGK